MKGFVVHVLPKTSRRTNDENEHSGAYRHTLPPHHADDVLSTLTSLNNQLKSLTLQAKQVPDFHCQKF